MPIRLTHTQIVMLTAAAQRDDRCLSTHQNLKGAVAQRAASKLIDGGLAKEIKAKPGAPVWRQDAGLSFALRLTVAGFRAVAADDRSASDETSDDGGERLQIAAASSEIISRTAAEAPTMDAARSSPPRDGTKLAKLVELLQRDQGATISELVAAMDWLPHTTRAALTGLRKRGYAVSINRSEEGRSAYRARLGETINIEVAAAQRECLPTNFATPKSKNARRAEERKAGQAA